MYAISPSEVDAYLNCKRKHWYGYGFKIKTGDQPGIRPVSHSANLQRGTDGHSILGDFYTMIKEGVSFKEATKQAMNVAAAELAVRIGKGDKLLQQTMSEAMDIVGRYFEYYGDESEHWEPLAIEREFRIQNSENTVMAFKPDGIFRDRSTGEISVWDHKLLWNHYKSHAVPIMPQLPKYAGALRALGYPINGAYYNVLSTRKNVKKNAFVRFPKPVKATAIKSFLDEQQRASIEIAKLKDDPERWSKALRTASYFNCEKCPFLTICIAELEQQEGVKLLAETFYMVNDYRYANVESSEI